MYSRRAAICSDENENRTRKKGKNGKKRRKEKREFDGRSFLMRHTSVV